MLRRISRGTLKPDLSIEQKKRVTGGLAFGSGPFLQPASRRKWLLMVLAAALLFPSLSQASETLPDFQSPVGGFFETISRPSLDNVDFLRVSGFASPALFVAQVSHLMIDGFTDEVGPADAIVILGTKVNPGGKPSDRLKARLNRGYDLYKQGLSGKIIVTGGVGKEGYSEAQAMADYLGKLGVPRDAILLERNAKNTYQNALLTRKMTKGYGVRSVIVVSQYFHLPRAKLAFRKAGFKRIYSAHAYMFPEFRDPYAVIRELKALDRYCKEKRPRERPEDRL